MPTVEELEERADRARAHLEEVRLDNARRERTAWDNWLKLSDEYATAAEEEQRRQDQEAGIERCGKCGFPTNEPGGQISDDGYSQFPCPFHHVS